MQISEKWIKKHFTMAMLVSCYSKDTSTKCGAVIVRPDNSIASTGYNGFPRGVDDNILDRYERPAKYLYTEHAERNAIYNCQDQNMNGYSLFVYTHPNELFICSDCARAIIQSGIKHIYSPEVKGLPHWEDSCEAARNMFEESGVSINHRDIPDQTFLIELLSESIK